MTKNDFIYALKASGCLYHNRQTYYEENELIRTFEDMEMFEEEKSLKDMTKLEHAIKHIKTRADAWAVKEVEKALSQEPCDDAISREAVLERAINVPIAKLVTNNKVIYRKVVFVDDIENLPPVTQKPNFCASCKHNTDTDICLECEYDGITRGMTRYESVTQKSGKWDRLYSWLNDMRLGIAPDETVTDIDERHCRESQTDILDEIMEWMIKAEVEPQESEDK